MNPYIEISLIKIHSVKITRRSRLAETNVHECSDFLLNYLSLIIFVEPTCLNFTMEDFWTSSKYLEEIRGTYAEPDTIKYTLISCKHFIGPFPKYISHSHNYAGINMYQLIIYL